MPAVGRTYIIRIENAGGAVLTIHHELFDVNGMSDCGFAMDPEYLSKKTHISWARNVLDYQRSKDGEHRISGNRRCGDGAYPVFLKRCQEGVGRREKAASADQPKPMLLCEDIAEQKVLLGSQLFEEQEKTLIRFLFNNKDVFAWSANDLYGVNRDGVYL